MHCVTLNANTAAKGHQSVKKAGVNQPGGTQHISVDDGSSDMSADDDIEESIEQPSVIAASLVVGSLIVVPLSVALLVTVCARLHRQGEYFRLLLFLFSIRQHSHINNGPEDNREDY